MEWYLVKHRNNFTLITRLKTCTLKMEAVGSSKTLPYAFSNLNLRSLNHPTHCDFHNVMITSNL